MTKIELSLNEVAIARKMLEGYDMRKTWPDEWTHVPGGPFHCDAQSVAENRAWLTGWKQGYAELKGREVTR